MQERDEASSTAARGPAPGEPAAATDMDDVLLLAETGCEIWATPLAGTSRVSGFFRPGERPSFTAWARAPDTGGRPTLAELEHGYIREILNLVGGNKSEAARILGIDRKTLYRRLSAKRG